jgi:hypothetical protein
MPNNASNPFDDAAKRAAEATDQELAGEEAKIKPMGWGELKKMLPDPVDQKNLDNLMAIVNSATDHNEKVAVLIKNIQTLGGIVIKALGQIR